jgi:hypothetical protein
VLLIGGADTLRVTDLNPITNRESSVTVLSTWRILPAVALLSSGDVLVSGGLDISYQAGASADLIDPVAETWSEVATMAEGRFGHQLTLLPGGDLLVIGGATVTESGAQVLCRASSATPGRRRRRCPRDRLAPEPAGAHAGTFAL